MWKPLWLYYTSTRSGNRHSKQLASALVQWQKMETNWSLMKIREATDLTKFLRAHLYLETNTHLYIDFFGSFFLFFEISESNIQQDHHETSSIDTDNTEPQTEVVLHIHLSSLCLAHKVGP